MSCAPSCDCFSLPAECRMFTPQVVATEGDASVEFARLSRSTERYAAVHVRGRGHVIIRPELRRDGGVEWVP